MELVRLIFKNMLSKMQKIWLWIFGAMFLVPEIFWSPVSNLYYELSQTSKSGGTHPFRNNFLTNSDNIVWLAWILFLQFFGSICFAIFMWKNIKKGRYYWIGAIFSTLLALVSFLPFYLSITIGMHGIG